MASRVNILGSSERVEEIARMLGGVKITETTRKHAAECLASLPGPCQSLFEGREAWRVELSPELAELTEQVRRGISA